MHPLNPRRLPWQSTNKHHRRAYLEEDVFIDHERKVTYRNSRECPYEVYVSGASPSGGAALYRPARTMKQAVAFAESLIKIRHDQRIVALNYEARRNIPISDV